MNAVVTYIFGKDAEILREPLVVDPGVEYICVTDQPSLTSEHWRIVADDLPQAKCTRDKMPMVKYNPFKYTDADNVFVMDGTIQISSSLLPLYSQLSKHHLMVKLHRERHCLHDELNAWCQYRQMRPEVILKFQGMALHDGIDLTNQFLVESCIIGFHKSPEIIKLCYLTLEYMRFLGDDGLLCKTNQCPFTYLIEKYHVQYHTFNQDTYFYRYGHNSWKRAYR